MLTSESWSVILDPTALHCKVNKSQSQTSAASCCDSQETDTNISLNVLKPFVPAAISKVDSQQMAVALHYQEECKRHPTAEVKDPHEPPQMWGPSGSLCLLLKPLFINVPYTADTDADFTHCH